MVKKQTKQTKKEFELEDVPFFGGLFKGIGKFIDLAEKIEEAGGEIKKMGEIKGLGEKAKGIYGFSIKTGLGKLPKIQTFGNIKPVEKKPGKKSAQGGPSSGWEIEETREPIVDIFDEKDHILIIAELPGALKESIKLDIKGDILILDAGDEKRKYSKEILLPSKVDFQSREENFNNGVLEVKIPKVK